MFQHLHKLRLWRLQFGLRALLLMMAVVAVALTIYRWPWEEVVETSHQPRFKTRYHRGWNGKPVKHGWEIIGYTKDVSLVERLYDEDELRFTRNWYDNKVVSEGHFRGGKLHGPYWVQQADGRQEGIFQDGKTHGVWQKTGLEVIDRAEWQAGDRHGPRTWKTPAGRLLQSAEYEKGKLVRWNDQPVELELRRWLESTIPDAERRQTLWSYVDAHSRVSVEHCYYGQVLFWLENPGRKLVVQCTEYYPEDNVMQPADKYADVSGQRLIELLLEDALENSHTLAFRFNVLHLVPITAASLDWRDRTGVYDVQFVPNSPQATAWLREVEADRAESRDPGARFRAMFEPEPGRRYPVPIAPEMKTGIVVDTSAIIDPSAAEPGGALIGGGSYPGHNPPRARRDLLGQHLDREKCTCVQNGNTLIIKRLE